MARRRADPGARRWRQPRRPTRASWPRTSRSGRARVRLRRPRRRLQPLQRADAAEAQPVCAVDHPGRVRHPDRPADRLPRRDQEPVGAQRQLDLRLRRGAPGAGPCPAGRPGSDDRGLRTLMVNPDRWRPRSSRGYSQATDLAEYVTQACGVDYRTAYQVVGNAVRDASRGGPARASTSRRDESMRRRGIDRRPLDLAGADLADVLDPARSSRPRRWPAGPLPRSWMAMTTACVREATAAGDVGARAPRRVRRGGPTARSSAPTTFALPDREGSA